MFNIRKRRGREKFYDRRLPNIFEFGTGKPISTRQKRKEGERREKAWGGRKRRKRERKWKRRFFLLVGKKMLSSPLRSSQFFALPPSSSSSSSCRNGDKYANSGRKYIIRQIECERRRKSAKKESVEMRGGRKRERERDYRRRVLRPPLLMGIRQKKRRIEQSFF